MISGTPLAIGPVLISLILGTASYAQGLDFRKTGSDPTGRAAVVTGKLLTISWQRLLTADGKTCDRCGGTEASIAAAEKQFAAALSPLGFRVVVEKRGLGAAYFSKNTTESNRIWIGNRPIEELLHAAVSSSACCGPCGDNECRSVTIDGRMYETIPPYLIVRAGLKAAADLLEPTAAEARLGRAVGSPPHAGAACCPTAGACCPATGVQTNSAQPPVPATVMTRQGLVSQQKPRAEQVLETTARAAVKNRPTEQGPVTQVFPYLQRQQADKRLLRTFGNQLY